MGIEDLFRANANDDCTSDQALFDVEVTRCDSTQISQTGDFSSDCFTNDASGAHKLYVRSTRNDPGSADGRTYHVYATVSDSCGQALAPSSPSGCLSTLRMPWMLV